MDQQACLHYCADLATPLEKLQVGREMAVEDSRSTTKLRQVCQSSTKKGAYPKGHKVHDERIFITYPLKTNPL